MRQRLRGLRQIQAQCLRGRHGGAGIINVVAARQVDQRGDLGLAVAEDDLGMLLVARDDAAHAQIGCRPRIAAVRAAVAAQMAVGHEVVFVLALALDAVGRVGDLRHMPGIDRRADAVEQDRVRHVVMQARDKGIVRVEAQDGVGAVLGADAELFERMRDLAVAVELVAEDVREDDDFGVDVFADELQRRLVRLDEGVGVFAAAGQRRMDGEFRRDAGQEVCAGFICKVRDSSVLPRLLDHARGRGLAVGARDDHGRHVPCKFTQQIRAELERHAPGKIRAASAQQADQGPAELAGKHCGHHS